MATIALERRVRSNGPLTILILLILLASISGVVLKEHAEKHRFANDVRECLNGDSQNYHMFKNPETNRMALCVQLPSGKWGIQIIEEVDGVFEEVTSFIKNKMSKIEQVIKYLNNRGYY